MRAQSTDPHIWKYDNRDELVACPECHTYMVPLKDYDMSSPGESPAVGAEPWEFIIWGWMAFVYNYIYDLFTHKGRLEKLTRHKKEILPEYPNSLVCPGCLSVTKKK